MSNLSLQEPNEKPAKRENPHKYLLYKPTFSQLFTFLSASFKVSICFIMATLSEISLK